ncbi:hypothetical protein [Amycolatopsis pigmentata]|uniref:Uncharacterized protein n=1 Tax=Amycolatopsis pigmentata TaxID=450801 RepID=A0ABW5FR20_9PSEU
MSVTVSPTPTLTQRFSVVSVLPTMVLIAWPVFLIGCQAFTGRPRPGELLRFLGTLNVAQVSVLALLAVAIGSLFHPFQFLLVRLLEGYWSTIPVLRTLAPLGVELNRRRMRRLVRRNDGRQLRKLYPPDESELLPTKLGNVLRAGERQAGRPYGMDAVLMLPRIYPVASPGIAAAFLDRRNQLDVAARYTAVSGLMAVSGFVAFADDGAWLTLPAMLSGVTVLSYRAAVRTAVSYGEALRWLFDLNHAQVTQALGWPVPHDIGKLKDLNRQIEQWLEDDAEAPPGYRGPDASTAQAEPPPCDDTAYL